MSQSKEIDFYLLTFKSVTDAIAAEKSYKGNVIAQIIPVPRAISESCGMALRLDKATESQAFSLFEETSDAIFLYAMGPRVKGKREATLLKEK